MRIEKKNVSTTVSSFLILQKLSFVASNARLRRKGVDKRSRFTAPPTVPTVLDESGSRRDLFLSRRKVKAFGKDEEEEDLRLCLLGTVLFLSLRFLYTRKGQTRDRSTEKDETFGRFRVLPTSPITKKKKKEEKSRPQKKRRRRILLLLRRRRRRRN